MTRYGLKTTRDLHFIHSYWDFSPLNVSCCLYYYLNTRYNDSLKARWSGDRIPLWVRFSYSYRLGVKPRQTVLYNVQPAPFPGVKWAGYGVDHTPPSNPRLRKEYSCTSNPPLDIYDLF